MITVNQPLIVLLLTVLGMLHALPMRGADPSPHVLPPDQGWAPLFADVQRARVFQDQKTFPDALPRRDLGEILADYLAQRTRSARIDLRAFVEAEFLLPETPHIVVEERRDVEEHVRQLWPLLRRAPDQDLPESSLLPLPHPYIVPGGRFREIYYWDSYFTMLGLRGTPEEPLIRSMVDNFAYLIRRYGLIPNGNRSYYLSRSQPPFFSLMVELLAESEGEEVYTRYLPELKAEHAYWNDETRPTRHRVELPDGRLLSRYHDQAAGPRAEAFSIDEDEAHQAQRPPEETYRHIRAACESGWDFSSRWLADGKTLSRIETVNIVPVDLNCLLLHLEETLARASRLADQPVDAARFEEAAAARKAAILDHCWDDEAGFFLDLNLRTGRRSPSLTLAGVFPLFVRIATEGQADSVRRVLARDFLKPGGLVTTLVESGEQWDSPNGWAPLQWVAIRGLSHYGHETEAEEIARRWSRLNIEVFQRTGKLMEKYNVVDTTLEAGGGEYPGQDGFGWTNGVLLALLKEYPVEKHGRP